MSRTLCIGSLLVATLTSVVHAQSIEPPEYLGVLAGAGSPQEPAGVRVYGTDLGWTFSHAGQLTILFGDSWSTQDSLCDVQTQGVPTNDDFQARLPATYSGGVPAIEILTQSASALDFERLRLLREDVSLDMSVNRTPLAGFSDGTRAVGIFQGGNFLRCEPQTVGKGSCPEPFVCASELGECLPNTLNVPQVCDVERQAGCYPQQPCVSAGSGFCVDPESPQPQLLNRALLEVDFVVQRASMAGSYDSKYTWLTNKFFNLTARTVERFAEDAAQNDYRPGTGTLLLWGRPGFFAGEDLHIPIYLLAHDLPLPSDPSGRFDFHPRYFAGVDSSGKPTWSSDEAQAAPLSLDGEPGGDPTETVDATNQMTISWLGEPIDKWLMLYGGGGAVVDNDIEPGYVALRFADHPWGPWSKPEVHLSEGGPDEPNTPLGPGGILYHPDCVDHASASCAASDPVRPSHILNLFCQRPLIETDVGFFYAPNIIQEYTSANADGGLDVYWNLSSWNPYRVHFLRSRVFAQSR